MSPFVRIRVGIRVHVRKVCLHASVMESVIIIVCKKAVSLYAGGGRRVVVRMLSSC